MQGLFGKMKRQMQFLMAAAVIVPTGGLAFAQGVPLTGSGPQPSLYPPSPNRAAIPPLLVPEQFNGANLYITGHVTGGAYFRGFIPYSDPRYFQSSLGSADLTAFRRDAVNLRRALAGYHRPQPYFDPARTTISLRDVLQTGRDNRRSPLSAGRVVRAATGVEFSQYTWQVGSQDLAMQSIKPLVLSGTPALPQMPQLPREPGELFGPMRQLSRHMVRISPGAQAALPTPTGTETTETGLPTVGTSSLQWPQPTDLPPKGQDSFSDLVRALSQRYWQNRLAGKPGPQTGIQPESEPNQSQQGPVVPLGPGQLPLPRVDVSHFSGKAKSMVNMLLSRGEQLMAQGHYYQAANKFGAAQAVDDRNPLTYVAKGHALLEAGEYMSAAYFILRAYRIYPQVVATKYDVKTFGRTTDIDDRVADLKQLVKRNGNPVLQFLLGYVQYHLGDYKQAEANLAAAAAALPADTAVTGYATAYLKYIRHEAKSPQPAPGPNANEAGQPPR